MARSEVPRRLSAWTRLGIVTNDRGKKFRVGDVCKVAERKGQYRIIGIDQHRSGLTELTLRKEVRSGVGKVQRVDIDDAVHLRPPYRAVW